MAVINFEALRVLKALHNFIPNKIYKGVDSPAVYLNVLFSLKDFVTVKVLTGNVVNNILRFKQNRKMKTMFKRTLK